MGRGTLAWLRRALTATTDTILMLARPTVITGLIGSPAEYSLAPVLGMAGEAVGVMDAAVGLTGAVDMVTDAVDTVTDAAATVMDAVATAALGTPDEGATPVAATAAASMVVVAGSTVVADFTVAVATAAGGTANRR